MRSVSFPTVASHYRRVLSERSARAFEISDIFYNDEMPATEEIHFLLEQKHKWSGKELRGPSRVERNKSVVSMLCSIEPFVVHAPHRSVSSRVSVQSRSNIRATEKGCGIVHPQARRHAFVDAQQGETKSRGSQFDRDRDHDCERSKARTLDANGSGNAWGCQRTVAVSSAPTNSPTTPDPQVLLSLPFPTLRCSVLFFLFSFPPWRNRLETS